MITASTLHKPSSLYNRDIFTVILFYFLILFSSERYKITTRYRPCRIPNQSARDEPAAGQDALRLIRHAPKYVCKLILQYVICKRCINRYNYTILNTDIMYNGRGFEPRLR